MSDEDIKSLDLEKPCDTCEGEGVYRPEYCSHRRPCPDCDGTGHAPTELGEKILDLMRRNFRSMLRDAVKN